MRSYLGSRRLGLLAWRPLPLGTSTSMKTWISSIAPTNPELGRMLALSGAVNFILQTRTLVKLSRLKSLKVKKKPNWKFFFILTWKLRHWRSGSWVWKRRLWSPGRGDHRTRWGTASSPWCWSFTLSVLPTSSTGSENVKKVGRLRFHFVVLILQTARACRCERQNSKWERANMEKLCGTQWWRSQKA